MSVIKLNIVLKKYNLFPHKLMLANFITTLFPDCILIKVIKQLFINKNNCFNCIAHQFLN